MIFIYSAITYASEALGPKSSVDYDLNKLRTDSSPKH